MRATKRRCYGEYSLTILTSVCCYTEEYISTSEFSLRDYTLHYAAQHYTWASRKLKVKTRIYAKGLLTFKPHFTVITSPTSHLFTTSLCSHHLLISPSCYRSSCIYLNICLYSISTLQSYPASKQALIH